MTSRDQEPDKNERSRQTLKSDRPLLLMCWQLLPFFIYLFIFAEVYSVSADRSQHLLLTLARNQTTGRFRLQMSDLPMTPRGDGDDALQEPDVPEKFSVRFQQKGTVVDPRRRPPPPPQPSPSPAPPPPPPRRRQTRERRCRPPAAAVRRGSARSPRYFRRAWVKGRRRRVWN